MCAAKSKRDDPMAFMEKRFTGTSFASAMASKEWEDVAAVLTAAIETLKAKGKLPDKFVESLKTSIPPSATNNLFVADFCNKILFPCLNEIAIAQLSSSAKASCMQKAIENIFLPMVKNEGALPGSLAPADIDNPSISQKLTIAKKEIAALISEAAANDNYVAPSVTEQKVEEKKKSFSWKALIPKRTEEQKEERKKQKEEKQKLKEEKKTSVTAPVEKKETTVTTTTPAEKKETTTPVEKKETAVPKEKKKKEKKETTVTSTTPKEKKKKEKVETPVTITTTTLTDEQKAYQKLLPVLQEASEAIAKGKSPDKIVDKLRERLSEISSDAVFKTDDGKAILKEFKTMIKDMGASNVDKQDQGKALQLVAMKNLLATPLTTALEKTKGIPEEVKGKKTFKFKFKAPKITQSRLSKITTGVAWFDEVKENATVQAAWKQYADDFADMKKDYIKTLLNKAMANLAEDADYKKNLEAKDFEAAAKQVIKLAGEAAKALQIE
ncbi:Uncharacterised protein [uncultured archaeon]|nr:Uncharacterised protein [uncultured archaeon]